MSPDDFNHRTERLSTGNTYRFIDEGDKYGSTTLLLIHGFPDFSYGWRHQIKPWASKGWRVVAPDMLGYGGTHKPDDIHSYTTRALCADLAALLDCIGVRKAVVIGHDWGASTAWRFCLWHPNRVSAVIGLSVPFHPPARAYIPPEEIALRFPDLAYQLYFYDEQSTKEIEGNLPVFFDTVYRSSGDTKLLTSPGTDRLSIGILTEKEKQLYIGTFAGKMNGPLNYYRTGELRFEEERDAQLPSKLPQNLPALFFYGTNDSTCQPIHVNRSKKFVPSLEVVMCEGAGHWLMVERKELITKKVDDWIENLLSKGLLDSVKSKL